MGCDIHLHVEIQYKGEWIHFSAPHVDRNYWLFGVLAAVLVGDKPLTEPKGLPADISLTTKIDYEYRRYAFHTPSWLNEEEIMELEDRLREKYDQDSITNPAISGAEYDLEIGVLNKTYFYGNSLVGWKRSGNGRGAPDDVEGIRLVFWFDN